jgi:hypothetical protein
MCIMSHFTGNTCRQPWSVTGIALLFYMQMIFLPHRKHTHRPPRPVRSMSLRFWYVYNIHASEETHVSQSSACYKDSFIFLYVDGICITQETRLYASTACYGDSVTFLRNFTWCKFLGMLGVIAPNIPRKKYEGRIGYHSRPSAPVRIPHPSNTRRNLP